VTVPTEPGRNAPVRCCPWEPRFRISWSKAPGEQPLELKTAEFAQRKCFL
jgi:hypothetical protein